MKTLAEKLFKLIFGNIAINLLLIAILLAIFLCYSRHFQLAAICVLYVFVYFMFGHIMQAFYDLTHMDEYRARVYQKRLDKRALKEYLNRNTSRKRWIIF